MRLWRKAKVRTEAYDLLLRARELRYRPAMAEGSTRLIEQVVELDGTFAAGWSDLAPRPRSRRPFRME
jgi:hypothetical protein